MPTFESMDVVDHLRLLVQEEAFLWEAPVEATVVTAEGSTTTGPWSPQSCATILSRWVTAGLVGLFKPGVGPDTAGEDLPRADALAAVADVTVWRPNECDLLLFATDAGAATSEDVWREVAGPLD